MKIKTIKRVARKSFPLKGSMFEGCTLVVREPTREELIRQWLLIEDTNTEEEFRAKLLTFQIERVVVDWTGFENEDGTPVKFSLDALDTAMRQESLLVSEVMEIATGAFRGLAEDEAKNSETPSDVG